MNPDLSRLQPYPFERLVELNAGVVPPADRQPIPLSIGEPKHTTPVFIAETVISLSLIHISEPTRQDTRSRMPASA